MSKKMNELLCCIFVTIFICVFWFALLYVGASFVEGSFSLTQDARQAIVFIFGFSFPFAIMISLWGLGPMLSQALEDNWKD